MPGSSDLHRVLLFLITLFGVGAALHHHVSAPSCAAGKEIPSFVRGSVGGVMRLRGGHTMTATIMALELHHKEVLLQCIERSQQELHTICMSYRHTVGVSIHDSAFFETRDIRSLAHRRWHARKNKTERWRKKSSSATRGSFSSQVSRCGSGRIASTTAPRRKESGIAPRSRYRGVLGGETSPDEDFPSRDRS